MKGDVMKKLLIVEDDNDLREGLEFTFRSEKYVVFFRFSYKIVRFI